MAYEVPDFTCPLDGFGTGEYVARDMPSPKVLAIHMRCLACKGGYTIRTEVPPDKLSWERLEDAILVGGGGKAFAGIDRGVLERDTTFIGEDDGLDLTQVIGPGLVETWREPEPRVDVDLSADGVALALERKVRKPRPAPSRKPRSRGRAR